MIPHATLTEAGVARVVTVALHAGRIRLRPGTVFIEPDVTMAAFDAAHPNGADYVIVPALVDHENVAIAAWIRAQAAHGATIVSICEGARTVAKSGVLEGRRATTHWSARCHPPERWTWRSISSRHGTAAMRQSSLPWGWSIRSITRTARPERNVD